MATSCTPRPAPLAHALPDGIAADVFYLASPALAGRATGTAGGDSAAAYIARRYEKRSIPTTFRVMCDTSPNCGPSYFQFFSIDGVIGQNVAAVVVGSDSLLRREYVVVGAHYDHLGRSPGRSRDASAGDVVRPGADDNASGTAAALELARRIAAHPPRRSVLFVHFDAEELGLVGSRVFVEHAPVPLSTMVLMINLDMVGRFRAGGLIIDASGASGLVRALVDSAATELNLALRFSSATASRSDHASFRRAGVQAIELFTGFHEDYHRATDLPARVDLQGIAHVVDVAESILRRAADRAAP